MAGSTGDHHMSKDVIAETLSRLPVKSLMRFRCVCKSWCSLIRNSSFITKHIHNCKSNARLLVQHYNCSIEKYTFALFPDATLGSASLAYHDFDDLQKPSDPPEVMGPSNGILCLWDWEQHLSLWNPAMKEHRLLPPVLNPDLPSHFRSYCNYFGFGLDLSTNHYKVVWIRYFWDEKIDTSHNPAVVAVFNLGTNSWRLFELEFATNRSIDNSTTNTYTNGAYYWLGCNDVHNYMVLAFDMDSEDFRELAAPADIPKPHWALLALYNDFVAMILYNPDELQKCFDIWVMKEEGSWTKQVTVGPLEVEKPLGIWINGELFMETSASQLVLYSPNTKELKNLGPCGNNYCLKVFTYQESLVSVHGGNDF